MTVLDRVPVDRITVEAREVRFLRVLLAALAGVLYGFGWLVAKAFGLVWFALAWAGTAVKLGWSDARSAEKSKAG